LDAGNLPRCPAIATGIDLGTLLREIQIYPSFWDQVAHDGPSHDNEQEPR
jgi:hypothetical protein